MIRGTAYITDSTHNGLFTATEKLENGKRSPFSPREDCITAGDFPLSSIMTYSLDMLHALGTALSHHRSYSTECKIGHVHDLTVELRRDSYAVDHAPEGTELV